MRISDWSSDVCSSDLVAKRGGRILREVELSTGVDEDLGIRLLRLGSAKDIARCLLARVARQRHQRGGNAESAVALLRNLIGRALDRAGVAEFGDLVECRSEEHTSELQSLMRISYAVFCLKKKQMNKKTREVGTD